MILRYPYPGKKGSSLPWKAKVEVDLRNLCLSLMGVEMERISDLECFFCFDRV